MHPQEFVNKWANSLLGEKQIAQAHFLDVCRLVGVEMPGADGKTDTGDSFVFEQSLKQITGHGFADVYYQGHFAVEYKAPDKYKDLKAAYQQLQRYRENLNNPPLLVVTDINHWEIHTNFPNTAKQVYAFSHSQIASDPKVLGWLRALFHAPERLHPGRNTEQVTKEAADAFQLIADNMRDWDAEPKRIAYFLTKLVFCLFAEDVGLLPTAVNSPQGIFTHIIEQSRAKPGVFKQYVRNIFVAMNEGGNILMQDIPYFNGTLFNVVTVEELSVEALAALEKAAKLNWEAIEPSIFGTLFERSLDPNKRSQLGAHYTSREDILLIVDPVLMQPLRYEWDTIQLQAEPVRERYEKAGTGRAKSNARNQLLESRERMLNRIRATTVLDPACGSGNFLYVSLQLLMDLEKEVIQHSLWAGLQMPTPEVHPRQMYGIEIDPIAHALASIVVWIGYIQWRQNNGYGQSFKEPILEELQDNIVCKDAILPPLHPPSPIKRDEERSLSARTELSSIQSYDSADDSSSLFMGEGFGVGADWPAVDVIVGNPPFLGNRKMRPELGDEYVDRLVNQFNSHFGDLTPDLVCYWHQKALTHLENRKVKRVGLLATNSIRGGTNRHVLQNIVTSANMFNAWSDREWILDGAAVRVSMICFDNGEESSIRLDGIPVRDIFSDLTADVDVTSAKILDENKLLSFQGIIKRGPFDMDASTALSMIKADPKNKNVLKPIANGLDITRRSREKWIIDFGVNTPKVEAMEYRRPFEYVETFVRPMRQKTRQPTSREFWWLHWNSRPAMREALSEVDRYIATPTVAKHRIFVRFDKSVHPDHQLIVFPRDDDYFFGVLHSKLHQVWSLRLPTWHGDGKQGSRRRYTPTTTFETFPFPWPPGSEDTSHPAHAAISRAAKQLHQERHAWQNPHPPTPIKKEGEESREKWDTSPELERRMQAVAREFRKNSTFTEGKLWQAIQKKQLDGREFRRQVAIGAFVVDFYCSSERLAIEVDGSIHDEQQEADRIRQELIESLGIRFVRLSNDEVEYRLESSLKKIRRAFGTREPAKSDKKPLPLDGRGVWGGGDKSLKDRTLTNLYNALQVWRGLDSMKTKPAANDFAPRLDELHQALDHAVCDAYGWEHAILEDEEEILRRLLALNLGRAGSQ